MEQLPIISHIVKDDSNLSGWRLQSNEDHQEGVANLAGLFAREFGMGSWGLALGRIHDKGKERTTFQQHIRKESGYDETIIVEGESSHAFIGAINASSLYGQGSQQLLANQIAGHHAGLYDYTELEAILQREIPPEITFEKSKVTLERPPFSTCKEDFHHLGRMLYSCLVDADFLDTESFMDSMAANLRQKDYSLPPLRSRLEQFLLELRNKSGKSEVNEIRQAIQDACLSSSKCEKGFYSLTVPTGGGKTLSSLVWAISHAIRNGQKRIIIAIPFTSIIIQTASILKSIFGEENVLEHHSNIDPESVKDDSLRQRYRLAAENWDYPIVVTTNVQLFESMFSNKPSDCRKLHNIANSVLILDEVQTLPADYLQPIVDSLKSYSKMFNVSVLFTTASQPVLSGLIEGCNPMASFKGIDRITEIISPSFNLHDKLRRVRLDIEKKGTTYDELAGRIASNDRVLCIVNTRKDAKEIYERLPKEGLTLHLSRMMCPDHVNETISAIKVALKDNSCRVIRVIATQLVEAGVDIDFPVVYRQEAGLDSELQAAGRCNREGKLDICTTHIFSLSSEGPLPPGAISQANAARKSLPDDSDWFAPGTMTAYFKQLYCRRQTFDRKDMKHYLYKPQEICYETASREFKLIDDNSTPVVVNWKNSSELISRLEEYGPSYNLMRVMAKYSVNVRERDLKVLIENRVVSEVIEGVFALAVPEMYDEKVGLVIKNKWLEETFII